MLRVRYKFMPNIINNTFKSIFGISYKNNKISAGDKKHLDPTTIPKYKNQLEKPYIYHPMLVKRVHRSKKGDRIRKEHLYFIDISEFKQQVLPEGFPKTTVLGCGGLVKEHKRGTIKYVKSFPGGTFEAIRNIPLHIKWKNRLKIPVKMQFHGVKKPFMPDETYQICPNKQEPSVYWYYGQHREGTDLKDYGLTGFYLLRDDKDKLKDKIGLIDLPGEKYEYPILIQDFSFYTDGSFMLPQKNNDKPIYDLFGDTIVVNGKVWPNLDVERRQYRFYILNGSKLRFYKLKLSNNLGFTLIGGDKGLLPEPVIVDEILLTPGERADVLIDFSRLPVGSKIYMTNEAKAPYPDGIEPDTETTGQIMRFTIPEYETISITPVKLPEKLYEQSYNYSDLPKKVHTISEDKLANDTSIQFNGLIYEIPIKITPDIKSPEEWIIINLTGRTFPLYLTDVKIKIINRQKVDIFSFNNEGEIADEKLLTSHLIGEPIEPENYETGWKDTIRIDQETVTRIVVVPSAK